MKTIAQQLNIKKFPFKIIDENGNKIYLEDENGNWSRGEYDSKGNLIYFESSNGTIIDNRPPEVVEMTMEEVNKSLGKNVKIIEG